MSIKAVASAVGLGALVFLLPVSAQAQAAPGGYRGFAVNRFEPSERGSDWFASESLDYRGRLRPALGVSGDYAYRSFLIFKQGGDVNASVVRNSFYLHPGGSLVLADRFRVAFSLPIQAFAEGRTARFTRNGTTTTIFPPSEAALGDLRLGADARLFGRYGGPVTMALGLQFWAPTGNAREYAGDDEIRLKPRLMVAGDVEAFTYAAQVAFNYRVRDEVVGTGRIGSEMNVTLATGARLVDKSLVIGPELWASTALDDAFGKKSTPAEVALGAHYRVADRIHFGLGAGTGLTRSYGAPVSRVLFNVEWAPGVIEDRDKDGVRDEEDACPDVRGVHSADPARNGCPPPAPPPAPPAPPSDRDKDGVPDAADACPDKPGVKTNDPATNGCIDTDGDGIFDPKDACIDEKGVASADPASNGCPDEDEDGIADKFDACPTIKGVPNADKTRNGCPADFDRDHDGITNNVDACPDDPGKPDPDPLKNGCPAAFVSAGQIKILEQINFKTGSATLEKSAETTAVLQAVEKVLRDHPDIKKVRVEGHTDNTGSAKGNKKLSADRAAAVVKWLVAAGIARNRLTSAGIGADRPLDSNATDAGRKANRRVEFHIE